MRLLERQVPLTLLAERIARLRRLDAGAGACVIVSGEAGVGKTSLLRQAQDESAQCADWLWGSCEPLLAPPPLAPLLDWLDRLPPTLAAAVRSGRQSADVLAGLLEMIRHRRTPVVLVIDDAHWADGATLDLVRFIGRRIESTRALLLLGWRQTPGTGDKTLGAFAGQLPPHSTLHIELQSLSPAAVAEIAGHSGHDAAAIYRVTLGNPFFVAQVVESADAAGSTVPVTVRDAVLARASLLTVGAREVLDFLSVSPSALEREVIDAIFDGSAQALPEGVAAGLIVDDGELLSFRHELTRRSLESALSPHFRQSAHTALFDSLSLRGASAARLVHHAEHGGLRGAVLRLAPLAAYEAAQRRAFRQAADLYELTLRHAVDLPADERARLHAALADQWLLLNRFEAALDARQQALALRRGLDDRLGEGSELRQIARLHWLRGRAVEGQAAAAQAITLLSRIPGAETEHALAMATMAQLHVLDDTPATALEWARRALPLLEAGEHQEGLVYVLNTLGMAQMDRGEDHAWACVERSLELARSHGWSEHALRAYVNLASAALVHRRLDLLERVCTDGLAFCEAGDIDLFASALAIRRARGLIARARFGEASAVLRACLARADLHGLEAEQARYALDTIAMRCGEWSDDAAWTALIEGRRGLKVDPWYAPQALIRVEAAWLRGEHAWVRRIGAEVLPIWIARGESWRIGQMAVWLRRVGDGFDSGNLVLPPPCALEIGGDPAEAARQWAAMGCAYEQALTLACGDESCLRQALTLADQIGAHPLARIARQRLRELGVRDVARGPIRGTRADPLGLTARERTVLNLLAEGLSNRQIAGRLHRSERTVENHVAALLAKLNVETRAQAAAFAGREN